MGSLRFIDEFNKNRTLYSEVEKQTKRKFV